MQCFISPRLLFLATAFPSFLIQDAAKAWSIPKQEARITVPHDFPLYLPFYRVAVIPDLKEDRKVNFEILRIHMSGDNMSRSKPLLEIDKKNGSIWLIRKPTDLQLPDQGHYQLLANITITVERKRRMEILLSFSGSVSRFCQSPMFSGEPTYFISEGITEAVTIDYLHSPSYRIVCPNTSLSYHLDHDSSESESVTVYPLEKTFRKKVTSESIGSLFLSGRDYLCSMNGPI